jgi:hypothetical protein
LWTIFVLIVTIQGGANTARALEKNFIRGLASLLIAPARGASAPVLASIVLVRVIHLSVVLEGMKNFNWR